MWLSSMVKSLLPISLMAGLCATVRADNAVQTHHSRHHIVSQQSNKEKTATGYIRTTTKVDDAGATATRREEVRRDRNTGVSTRTVSGTTFEGAAYSAQSKLHKTDSGYTSEAKLTRPDGSVVNRTLVANVDKAAGTVTKNISTTPQGGDTSTRTLVQPLQRFHRRD